MTDLPEVTIVIPEVNADYDVVIGDPGVLPTVLEKLRFPFHTKITLGGPNNEMLSWC